jgi:hypothetical protein
MGNGSEIFGKFIGLEFVKRATGISGGLQKMRRGPTPT